jgi:hemerythrin superfamily protein
MPRAINALDLLRRDHRHVQALLKKMEKAEAEDEQRQLCEQIVDELRTHTEIEERVFYPYLREATAREDLFQEASIEHETAKQLLEQLPQEQPGTPRFKAMAKVLAEYVQHHVQEEESEIFPQVEKTGVDLKALGEALEEAREGGDPLAEVGGGEAAADDEVQAAAAASDGEAGTHSKVTAEDDERFLEEHSDDLSPSTRRAKWIHTPDDRAEHNGQTLATRNVEVIRAWAEARGAQPATTPGGDAERPRVLRFDFPGFGGQNLQPVSWDAWQRVFEERELVFLFQEKKKDGKQSNFFRLDSPEREDA